MTDSQKLHFSKSKLTVCLIKHNVMKCSCGPMKNLALEGASSIVCFTVGKKHQKMLDRRLYGLRTAEDKDLSPLLFGIEARILGVSQPVAKLLQPFNCSV